MLDNYFVSKIVRLKESNKRLIVALSVFVLIMFELTPLIALRAGGLDTILSFLLCFVIIAMSYDGQVSLQKKKRPVFFLTLLLGITEFISGMRLSVLGYASYGMFYMIVPVCLILVINSKKQIERLMFATSVAMEWSFCVLFILSVLFAPIRKEQYESILGNPNALGMYACIGFLGSFYLSVKEKGYWHCIMLGFSLGFVYFSRSRTSMILVLGSFVVLIFYLIINKKTKNFSLKSAILCVISVVISIFISFAAVSYLSSIVGITDIGIITKIESVFDVNIIKTDDDDVSFSDVLASGFDRSLKGIADDNSFTSGRIEIWKAFSAKLDFTGHLDGTMKLKGFPYNAHNAFLQVAYSYGIVSGIAYLILFLYVLFIVLKQFIIALKIKHISFEKGFAAILLGSFFVYSMLSAAVSPFSYFLIMEISLCVLPCIGTDFWNGKEYLLESKGV